MGFDIPKHRRREKNCCFQREKKTNILVCFNFKNLKKWFIYIKKRNLHFEIKKLNSNHLDWVKLCKKNRSIQFNLEINWPAPTQLKMVYYKRDLRDSSKFYYKYYSRIMISKRKLVENLEMWEIPRNLLLFFFGGWGSEGTCRYKKKGLIMP